MSLQLPPDSPCCPSCGRPREVADELENGQLRCWCGQVMGLPYVVPYPLPDHVTAIDGACVPDLTPLEERRPEEGGLLGAHFDGRRS